MPVSVLATADFILHQGSISQACTLFPVPYEPQAGVCSWFCCPIFEQRLLTVFMKCSTCLDLSVAFQRVEKDGNRQILGS